MIRCVSTPNTSFSDLSFNFEVRVRDTDPPPQVPTQQPFEIFIDNPRDYFSLSSNESGLTVAEARTEPEDSVFSSESSYFAVPHLFDTFTDPEGPEEVPLLSEMASDDEFDVPDSTSCHGYSHVCVCALGGHVLPPDDSGSVVSSPRQRR